MRESDLIPLEYDWTMLKDNFSSFESIPEVRERRSHLSSALSAEFAFARILMMGVRYSHFLRFFTILEL